MHRNLKKVFSQGCNVDGQGNVSHSFIVELYEVLGWVVEVIPDIQLETCPVEVGGSARESSMSHLISGHLTSLTHFQECTFRTELRWSTRRCVWGRACQWYLTLERCAQHP